MHRNSLFKHSIGPFSIKFSNAGTFSHIFRVVLNMAFPLTMKCHYIYNFLSETPKEV